ncbi:MAG: NAD(P)-dependent alcohol dehydrogenase [Clostridiales bacterium]|jgi:NADPH:quinone reductase-like Zn-dependent oxidoreductase|nr:NAD(P)-dependent alcohol dehydrogenase [Clostridiales bacterium]
MMKAAVCPQYGSPDVLRVREVEKPNPKANEVLIKVRAASINAYDWHKLRADTVLIRLMGGGLLKPKNAIPGCDFSGIAEAVGKNVTSFNAGDEVYGCLADGSGDSTFAEYVCAAEKVLAPKPSGVTFEEAAAVPMAAVTALQGLRDAGRIKPGQKVLINGASGGVGTFAVQLAKIFGAEVTAVCSARNIETARSLGADFAVDYTQDNFTKGQRRYDLILDIAANHTLTEYRRVLNPNGVCVTVGFSSFWQIFKAMLGGKKITLLMANNKRGRDLIYLNQFLKSGKIKPVIDRCYPLDEVSKAFWYFEKEHARGKVVIKVAP